MEDVNKGEEEYNDDMEYVPVTFTLGELWMLHDFVRHDEERPEKPPKFPFVSTRLNEDIALAIHACVVAKFEEYIIELGRKEILVIDAWVRRDAKTPFAKGEAILLKVFEARARLANMIEWPVKDEGDKSYKDAMKEKEERDAESSNSTDNDTDKDSDAQPVS